jgi:hypothetical protein
MKLTTAGQAGSRNNGPALTHFRDVGEEGILHFARWRYRRWFIGSPRGALIAGPDAASVLLPLIAGIFPLTQARTVIASDSEAIQAACNESGLPRRVAPGNDADYVLLRGFLLIDVTIGMAGRHQPRPPIT